MRVYVVPPVLELLQPGQLSTIVLHGEREPDVEPTIGSVAIYVVAGDSGDDAPLLRFKSRTNTIPIETPEDRGMIRVGKVKLRPAPAPWRLLACAAAPLVLAGWYAVRRVLRRRAAARAE